jgi:hypothetical protein
MPTARELLEQADALMRRNRAAAVDDIPVLTDSVALPADMSPTAAPVPAFTDVAAPAPRAAAHVPTLTEAVAVTDDQSVDSVIQEGEPSDWLHLEHGDPSIIGDAPDSIAIVPQVARPPVPDADSTASAELEEIELTTPADEAFDAEFEPADTYAAAEGVTPATPTPAAVEAETPGRPSTEAWFAPWSSPGAFARQPAEPEAPVALPPAEPVAMPAAAEPTGVPAHHAPMDETEGFAESAPATALVAAGSTLAEEPEPREHVAPVEAQAQAETGIDRDVAAIEASVREESAAPRPPESAAESTPLPAAPIPLAAPAPPVAVADDTAKWDAIAEEIRVQVLQRIDLFTDTGLREQLGMRLKPIVDRASADLVATINLHVGELLRAYVAEAIEREIENWRNNH